MLSSGQNVLPVVVCHPILSSLTQPCDLVRPPSCSSYPVFFRHAHWWWNFPVSCMVNAGLYYSMLHRFIDIQHNTRKRCSHLYILERNGVSIARYYASSC